MMIAVCKLTWIWKTLFKYFIDFWWPRKKTFKMPLMLLKFNYSEKATKIYEIFTLTVCTVVKSKGKILQNFVAFSEYMNFINSSRLCSLLAVSILYFEKKNRNRLLECLKIRQFDTYQIAFLMRNQGHKSSNASYLNTLVLAKK